MKRLVHCVMWLMALAGAAIATWAALSAILSQLYGGGIPPGEMIAGLALAGVLAVAPYCMARAADELIFGVRRRAATPSSLDMIALPSAVHQMSAQLADIAVRMTTHCDHLCRVIQQSKLSKTDVVCGWAAAIKDTVTRHGGVR